MTSLTSYSKLPFTGVMSWLVQNGDNKALQYYQGIRFDNSSHRRDADSILTALVKLRQRDESRMFSDKDYLQNLEDKIVEFCSMAVSAPRTGITHARNDLLNKKFKALKAAIKEAEVVFRQYGLDCQVRIRDLEKAGLLQEGKPSSAGLIRLRNRNFAAAVMDPMQSTFKQLMVSKLIGVKCIWSSEVATKVVKVSETNRRFSFEFKERPHLIGISVTSNFENCSDLLKVMGMSNVDLEKHIEYYQKKFSGYLLKADEQKNRIYNADHYFNSIVIEEETVIHNKAKNLAVEKAVENLLMSESGAIKDKILSLGDDAKKQMLNLLGIKI